MTNTSSLCDHCQARVFSPTGFNIGTRDSGKRDISYETSLTQIESSFRAGCNWCRLILDQPDALEDAGRNDTVTVEFRHSTLKLEFSPKGSNRFELLVNGWKTHLTAFTNDDDPTACFVTCRELRHQVGSDEAFQQAKFWLHECSGHSRCPKPSIGSLPTRVIDVDPDHTSSVPRLVETKGSMGQYAALSYCWGFPQSVVTRRDNIESFLQELPIASIARTINDAIYCTRKLGIRYLWVDAFCIVQDSAEDKVRELASMRRIYQSAQVTLVAASASNCRQGFLQDRAPPHPSYEIPVWTTEGTYGAIFLRPEGWYSSSQEPVNSRAWTLEEQLLSPRLLVYASHTLQWECATETKNWDNSIHLPAGHSIPCLFSDTTQGRSFNDEMHPVQLMKEMKSWFDIISVYSQRESTYPEDKLRALGGLAEEYHLRYHVQYLAGLWTGPLLPALLLWQANDYTRHNEPSYLAPTWSWPSVNCPVSYRQGVHSGAGIWHDVKIINTSITLKSAELLYGTITHGFIHMKARTREAWFEPPQYIRWEHNEKRSDSNATMDDRAERMRVMCLAISAREFESDNEFCKVVDGLLILPGQIQGEYYRVGCFFGAEEHEFANHACHELKLV